MLRLACVVSLVVVWLGSGVAAAGDTGNDQARWPQFRGPGGQGVGRPGLRLPTKFGPNEHVLWKTSLTAGHSSPCVWDDRIYVTGFDKQTKQLETICLERATGKIRWRNTAPAEKIERVHEINTPASSTPAADGDQVYSYFASYGLLCYSKDGEQKWQRPLDPVPSRFGSGTSPVVSGDLVLIHVGKGGQFALLALDRHTGKTVWEKARPRGFATGLWSTPVVRHATGGDEVIVAGGPNVEAYSVADGSTRWQVGGLPAISLSTPAIGDGLLFLTLTNPIGDLDENVVKLPSFDELLKKYDKNNDGKLSRDELPDDLVLFTRGRADKVGDWAQVRDMIGEFTKDKDKAINREEWQAMLDTMNKFTSTAQIAVAAIRLDGKGDISKTRLTWKESKRVPDVPSPLCYQGRVYLITDKGIVVCRDAKTGKEIYYERLGGRGACYSSPVVGDDKIYAGSDGGVLVVFKPGDRFEIRRRHPGHACARR